MKKHTSVSAYLNDLPIEHKRLINLYRAALKKLVPKAEESISYGMPGFKYKTRPLAYFGGFKNHVSYFPASGSVVDHFPKELTEYAKAKGTIQFTVEKPLPMALFKKILKYRLAQIEEEIS